MRKIKEDVVVPHSICTCCWNHGRDITSEMKTKPKDDILRSLIDVRPDPCVFKNRPDHTQTNFEKFLLS